MKKKKRKQGFWKSNYKKSWDYLRDCKNSFIIIIGIFVVSMLAGGLLPVPEIIGVWIKKTITDLVNATEGLNVYGLIRFILFNNGGVSFFSIILGFFFGVVPIITTIANGYMLGVVSKAVIIQEGFLELWRLLPHGIFELPAVIISLGLGLKFGMFIFQDDPGKEFVNRLVSGLRVFIFVVLPLLIIAAIIESILIHFLG